MIARGFPGCAAALLLSLALPALAAARGGPISAQSAAALQPGGYVWADAPAAPGPVSIVIRLDEQRAYVYRGRALIAVATVSSGMEGHETPTGKFSILQKQVDHKSTIYDDAPMPFMQRLTWDGIAIHAGRNPGHPNSHGCVRVPLAFAKKLFAVTRLGASVTVIDDAMSPALAAPAPRDAIPSSPPAAAEPPPPAPAAANVVPQPAPAAAVITGNDPAPASPDRQ